MTITYFVETNRIHKYLAFDAAESILGRIEEKLNQKNLLVGDGEIRRSMRAARNGYYYEYYTRLRNTVTNSQIQTIFHKLEQPLIDLKEVFTFSKKYHAIKLENQLLRLALEIKEKHPMVIDDNPAVEKNPFHVKKKFILRAEMISSLVSKKPTNIDEYAERIPSQLRAQTAPLGSRQTTEEYLERIFSIIDQYEGSSSASIATH